MDRPLSVTLAWLPDGTVNGIRFDMNPRPMKWSKDVIDCFLRFKFNEESWPCLEGSKPDEPDMFLETKQGFVQNSSSPSRESQSPVQKHHLIILGTLKSTSSRNFSLFWPTSYLTTVNNKDDKEKMVPGYLLKPENSPEVFEVNTLQIHWIN
ncbi:hypothetical protein BV898_12533 [Hypsibius exemplaris]|uniref:Uncharacterized protein n=1 Tax=Hypsibius exemplaris TaxID=2072580 RepID=A0A1W0WDD2_HYPEX|nr:hypothetical protein BV898_12533 [Hypsibius exemplaris]